MCGRFTVTKNEVGPIAAALDAQLDAKLAADWRPRHNAAPTQILPILRPEEGVRWLRAASWGLRRGADAKPLINARGETVKHLPAFRDAFAARRCVVPADGFLEWLTVDGAKQPVWFHRPDGGLLYMAGLWEPAQAEGKPDTFTIITTTPNPIVRPVHNRMPVLLAAGDLERWLEVGGRELLAPAPDDLLVAQRVSPRVNNVKNDDAGCLLPPEPSPSQPQLLL
jgi:putative SOS response-associated peptidase YedK